jgi:hypothetical protein
MKVRALAYCVGLLLICAGCNPPIDDTTAKKVAELEAKVEELEKRNSDLEFKGRMVTSHLLPSWSLRDFFASDEFWENTYDSGQADCSKRCVETLTSSRQACEDHAACERKQQCIEEAIARANQCQTRCSASNPPF